VVLAGRSNVGKSSLINRLVGRKGLARTSSTPGKTRSVNFYGYDGRFYLVDLPGFGYARGKRDDEWRELAESYFARHETVALVIQLVDARMSPTPLDLQFSDWVKEYRIPRLVAATKADKLSGNERVTHLRRIREEIAGVPVVLSSSVTGMGCTEIWNRVVDATQINNRREMSSSD
jgi:GTP-binding protein